MAVKVRGAYHERLRAALVDATRSSGGCDQTSLAEALNRDQSGISKYLRNDPKSGTMDLDEADRALRHCGLGGLMEFVSKAPPPADPVPPRVLAFLRENARELVRMVLSAGVDDRKAIYAQLLELGIRRIDAPNTTPGGAARPSVGATGRGSRSRRP